MDLDILAALRHRDSYEKYARFVKQSSLSDESWKIFQAMGEWFGHNPNKDVLDWQAFSAWIALVRFAKLDKEKLNAIRDIVSLMETREAEEDDFLQPLIEGLAKRDYAARIAEHALRMADGEYSLSFDKIDELIADYNRHIGVMGSMEASMGGFSLERLESVASPGLEWRLKCLREACGDIRKGDFIVFGKRPDTGGTTFMASEVTYMAEQLDDDMEVVWFNNEEQGDKVRRRIVQAATGWSSERMDRNLPDAFHEYVVRMGGNKDKIFVVDDAKLHWKDAERILKRRKPGLIVFDQLWKMKGFGELSADVLTQIFNWGRELCKEYAPLMAVHQAGGDADNVKWIEQSMLYFGKTGPQGEADAIITMGRLTDRGNSRYLYVPKNKLLTPGNNAMRNGRYEIEIDPEHARFKEP